jgi:Na+-driven multidrug efflux pump
MSIPSVLMLAAEDSGWSWGEVFVWWQIPLVLALAALIIFWVIYRRRQM